MRELLAILSLAISVLAFLLVSLGLLQKGFLSHDTKDEQHLTMNDATYCQEAEGSSYFDTPCPF
jgi:hypothetical protein